MNALHPSGFSPGCRCASATSSQRWPRGEATGKPAASADTVETRRQVLHSTGIDWTTIFSHRALQGAGLSEAVGNRHKLAAIMAADAAGYSRLMALDEVGTIAALDAARAAFRSQVESFQGRVVDMAGDSVLALFETATGAVNAATAVQAQLEANLESVPADRRMRFRIGVHLGDVIEKPDGSVYGDGVNIAARLQGLAPHGGILISDAVHGAVRHRIRSKFEDLGEQQVKNIVDPVRAYRVEVATIHSASQSVSEPWPSSRLRLLRHLPRQRWWALGALVALVAGFGTFIAVRYIGPKTADGPPLMSLGVLPFKSANGADDAAFADSFTRELTAAVGHSPLAWGTIVVSTNAVAGYRAQQTDARALGQQLGVRYFAEGEVRRDGDDVFSSLSLVDAQTARQVWSARIVTPSSKAREWPELPVLRAANQLRAALYNAEKQRVTAKEVHTADPVELLFRFNIARDSVETKEGLEKARGLCDQLVRLGPALTASAYCQAILILADVESDPGIVSAQLQQKIDGFTRQAVQKAPSEGSVWRLRSAALEMQNQREAFDDAMAEAIRLDPSSAHYRAVRAENMIYVGRAEMALPLLVRAAELNTGAESRYHEHITCHALLSLGRYDDAVGHCEKVTSGAANYWAYANLAALYAQKGDLVKATAARDKTLELRPEFTIAWFKTWVQRTSNNPVYQGQVDAHFLPGLRKARFAEK